MRAYTQIEMMAGIRAPDIALLLRGVGASEAGGSEKAQGTLSVEEWQQETCSHGFGSGGEV